MKENHFSTALRLRCPRFSWMVAAMFAGCSLPALAQSVVQEFLVPMPEAQIRQSFLAVASNTGNTFDSVISIVVPIAGAKVVYDHWEDGYETDLNAPVQSSTQIWGDGNDANGKPPGYATDPAGFSSGDVIALRNFVPLPRTSAILFDGRDRIGATQPIVVSRSAWATTPGPLLADATEVPSTADYGTSFTIPLGQNIVFPTPGTSSMFEFCSLFVQAAQNGTTVAVDADGNGVAELNFNLNRGESYLVNGGVNKGATVNSSKPVQVQLLTGDINANYENRWFTISPSADWSSEYYSPVGTAADGDETYIWLYNPSASAITVNYLTRVSSGSFSVPGKDTYRFLMPQNSGAEFSSSGGEPFSAVGTVGARPSQNNVHDWGFSLVPSVNLTTELVIGWGPGSRDLSQNGNPGWVTALDDTTIYVDYDGDKDGPMTDPNGGKYDVALNVSALEVSRIYESADKDQTGLRMYTLDGTLITGAWGQDPAVAGPAEPFLDVGTTIPNFPVPVLSKKAALVTDNGAGGLSVNSPADVVEFTITLVNKGLFALSAVTLTDTLPTGLAYVPGTTTRDAVAVPDAANPTTAFPLDEGGVLIPLLLGGESTVFKFQATITLAGSLTNVANTLNPVLSARAILNVPGTVPSPCTLFLTTSGGVETDYQTGAGIYVTLTDADANTDGGSAQTVTVVVQNLDNGDLETLILTETGNNTGVFRNTSALPSSTTAGGLVEDGTILGVLGQVLSVTYTDPIFGGSPCSDTATFVAPSVFKQLYLDTDGVDGDTTGDLDRVDPVATGDGSTSLSATITGPSSTPGSASFTTPGTTSWVVPAGVTSITVETWGGGGGGGGSSNAGSFTARGGAGGGGGAFASSVLAVTPGDTIFVTVGAGGSGGAGTAGTGGAGGPSFVGPGSDPVSATVRAAGGSGGTNNSGGGTPAGGAGGTAGASVGTTTIAGANGGNGATGLGISSGAGGAGANGGGSGGAQVTSAGTTSNGNPGTPPGGAGSGARTSQNGGERTGGSGARGEVVINYTAVIPGVSATFTQTPAFCSDFTLPAGGTITVKSYYTMVAGSIGSAVTATLKHGVTTFFTDATASAGSDANGTYLEWSATLGSPVTIPSGAAIALEITSSLGAGNTFQIQYDSSTKPSLISLPTTTAVTVDSVAVYDAPYPGGSLITTPANGQTVYVRAVVSDPFGAYDITSLPYTIDGPGVLGDLAGTLTDSSVVDTTSCSKTYEYVWMTGPTTGSYTITVTAKEGFENAVTDQKSTIVTITEGDLGTPCQSVFTSTLNGTVTTSFAADSTLFVRVTDLDQNTDPGVAEVLTTVSITSSTGDIELLTLTETGLNTGIFVGSVPSSTSGSVNNNNGTVWATAGSTLTLNYVDPDDALDPCSAIATIPSGSPAVSVIKTLLSPADGQIRIGEAAQFRLRVINTGDTTLNTVQVVDTFPSANLTYTGATPSPDGTAPAGTLTWNNVGPLDPGEFTDILVDFTGLASANPAVNTVNVTTGGGPTAEDTEPVIVTDPEVTVTKTRLTPASGTVNLGDNQTFRIVVQNTGDTILTVVPLEDTFSAACLEYVGATVAPDSVLSGGLLWDDLTGAGTLAVGASITIDVTFEVVGGCDPADNVAAVNFAVDEYDDPVPPDDDTASVETAAASISGTVFEDQGAAGFDDPNDVPLDGVTVRLFTDPNGDGDPADGVQVDVTTTDVNGDYEFLNLDIGNYVVVEEDPIGYFSVDDTEGSATDNRIKVGVIALTEYPDNDFLDDVIDTSDYGSLSGQVREDVDADGDFGDPDAGIDGVTIVLFTDPNGDGNPADGVPFATTSTSGGGNYSFPSVPPGNYVVVETDPAGYLSTADVVGANDNRIPATVPVNTAVTGRDFLDTLNQVRAGNRIWNDNGAGGGTANDGLINGTEAGISGVTVEVYAADGFGNPTGPALDTTTTDANGYYFFTLPVGEYVFVIPASNFDNGGDPLFGLFSSGTSNGTSNGPDPDVDTDDSDDNGFNAVNPAATGVRSAAFTLTVGGEPTGESDLGPGDGAFPDSKSNLTIDFGFVSVPPTAVTLAYVRAFRQGGAVVVEWETITERDTVGFDVYRLEASGPVRVNGVLVPAENSVRGGVYRVVDAGAADGAQVYELVELETTGDSIVYGPFEVEVRPAAASVGVRVTSEGLELTYRGEPGVEYVLESTDDPERGRWRPVAPLVADADGLLRWVVGVEEAGAMQFFRVIRP